MELDGSFPRLRQPTTGIFPEPYEVSPHPHTQLCNVHFNIILLSAPRSPSFCLPLRHSVRILYEFLISPMRVSCPSHLILLLRLFVHQLKYHSLLFYGCSSSTSGKILLYRYGNILVAALSGSVLHSNWNYDLGFVITKNNA
jgi:hypothetical protein